MRDEIYQARIKKAMAMLPAPTSKHRKTKAQKLNKKLTARKANKVARASRKGR